MRIEDIEDAFSELDLAFSAILIKDTEKDFVGALSPESCEGATISVGAHTERIPAMWVSQWHAITLTGSRSRKCDARLKNPQRDYGVEMSEFVNLEVRNAVGIIHLQRPKMNALNAQMQREIGTVAREVAERSDINAVVIYGGERVFAAGADVKEMVDMTYQESIAFSLALESFFSSVANIPQPTIAAITGFALGGGCELALACDFRVSADNAKLGQPEILLGIIPGAGGSQRLPRLIGPAKAKDLIFSGRFVDAEEALAIGLVDVVVPAEQVFEHALAWAQRLAAGPRIAMQAAKRAINSGLDVDLNTGIEIERQAFSSLFATDDARIGMQSFVENGAGKATFTGQ